MAFLYGLACAIYWSLLEASFNQLESSLQRTSNFTVAQSRIAIYTLYALQFALPVAMMVVAWRQGRDGGQRSAGRFVGALALLIGLCLTLAPLLNLLAAAPAIASPAMAFASALVAGYPTAGLLTPFYLLGLLFPQPYMLAISATYVWGASRSGGSAGGANRWRAVIRWLEVGASAAIGYELYAVAKLVIYEFITPLQIQSQLHSLLADSGILAIGVLVVASLLGAVIGGAFSGVRVRPDAPEPQATAAGRSAPLDSATRPGRMPVWLALALVLAGVFATLGLLANVVYGEVSSGSPPALAQLAAIALPPLLLTVVALIGVIRRLGARGSLGVLLLVALGYAPLLVETVEVVSARLPGGGDLTGLILDYAPMPLIFSLSVALVVFYGSRDPARWRRRAALMGALIGVGYAAVYLGLAIWARTTPLGPCYGLGGCYLQGAFRFIFTSVMETFAVTGFGLAMVGATVGGWLPAK